jgi:hypothetical protein
MSVPASKLAPLKVEQTCTLWLTARHRLRACPLGPRYYGGSFAARGAGLLSPSSATFLGACPSATQESGYD